MKKKCIHIFILTTIILIVVISAILGYKLYKLKKLSTMSFDEMLMYTTKDNENARITVGIIKEGVSSYTVYGNSGVELPPAQHTYEIGSITKTFTAAMINKAIEEGDINLEDTIDKYLDVPKRSGYPTIKSLLTHTSGYKNYYFETPMIRNFFTKSNDYYGISKELLLERIRNTKLEEKKYKFDYSNFGISILGLIIEEIYGVSFKNRMNDYVTDDLKLKNTKCSDNDGDLGEYWEWKQEDAYLPAGGLTSTIDDMLIYAQQQLSENSTHNSFAKINASSAVNKKMNIHMDEIGMAWLIDNANHVVWHNGATGNYNCYIGIDKENDIAVVILSNLPPNYRIPATVMGIELLVSKP